MSKLIEVLSDHLANAQLDDRLTRREHRMLEGLTYVFDADREGTEVFTYFAQVEALAAAEDAAMAKRQRKAGRTKSSKRQHRSVGVEQQASCDCGQASIQATGRVRTSGHGEHAARSSFGVAALSFWVEPCLTKAVVNLWWADLCGAGV